MTTRRAPTDGGTSGQAAGPAPEFALSDVVTSEEAARIVGVREGTLRCYRSTDQGPPWFRLGGRKIGYLRQDLEQWLRARIESSRVEPGNAWRGTSSPPELPPEPPPAPRRRRSAA